jgi:hypothetical protein
MTHEKGYRRADASQPPPGALTSETLAERFRVISFFGKKSGKSSDMIIVRDVQAADPTRMPS